MAEISVRKRGSKWEYRFEAAKVEGKRKHISKGGFKTKKEALDAGAVAMTEYNNAGTRFVPSEISVSDFFDLWIEEYCMENLKSTSVAGYRKKIRLYIKPAIGKYRLDTISPVVIQTMLNDLFNRGISRNSLSAIARVLSGAFNYAVNTARLTQNNPMQSVKIPSSRVVPEKVSKECPHVYIPPERIEQIFRRFPEGSSAFLPMQFGYRCGMRLGEAFAVFWEDIDFENKILYLRRQAQWDECLQSWFFSLPKYDSCREIDIDDYLCGVLRKAHAKQLKCVTVYEEMYTHLYMDERGFMNTDGHGTEIHPVTVRDNGDYIAPRIMQHTSWVIHSQLNFPEFTFHSFRHTHATMLAEQNAPLKYVQDRLGHKDVSVTMQVYQHVSNSMREKGSEILDRMFTDGNIAE